MPPPGSHTLTRLANASYRPAPRHRHGPPGPALRVVLVKVGEEELASASIPALTGQVHGLGTIDTQWPWQKQQQPGLA